MRGEGHKLQALESIRGIASLAVVCCHLTLTFFAGCWTRPRHPLVIGTVGAAAYVRLHRTSTVPPAGAAAGAIVASLVLSLSAGWAFHRWVDRPSTAAARALANLILRERTTHLCSDVPAERPRTAFMDMAATTQPGLNIERGVAHL